MQEQVLRETSEKKRNSVNKWNTFKNYKNDRYYNSHTSITFITVATDTMSKVRQEEKKPLRIRYNTNFQV